MYAIAQRANRTFKLRTTLNGEVCLRPVSKSARMGCTCVRSNTPLCIVLEWQETPAGSPKPNALLTNQSAHLQRSNESLQHDIT